LFAPTNYLRYDDAMPTVTPTEAPLQDVELALTRIVRIANLPRLHDRLALASGVALDRTVYPVLARVGDEGAIRLTDLAAALGLDTSTVSRHVQDLATKGLVERRPDPDDRRASVLSLTRPGHAALARIRTVRRDMLENLFVGWSPKDRRDLGRLLSRFSEALARQVDER